MMTLEQFTDKAISVPFVEKGRSWDGWDCWGVIFMAFKEVCDVDLPHYTGEYSSTIRRDELRALISKCQGTEPWSRIDTPRALDGVLLRIMGRNCHVGLMLDATHCLHVEARRMTFIDDINSIMWRGKGYDKVEGFYRHVSQI